MLKKRMSGASNSGKMRMIAIGISAIWFLAGHVLAEPPVLPAEWKSPGGEILKNAKISGWDAAYATVEHENGLLRIAIDAFPQAYRQAMSFDAKAAGVARAQAREERALAIRRMAAVQLKDEEKLRRKKLAQALIDQSITARAVVLQSTPYWSRCMIYQIVEEPRTRRVRAPGTMLDREPRFREERYMKVHEHLISRNAFVFGIENAKVGSEITGPLFPAQFYSYVTSEGEELIVERFGTYPLDDAMVDPTGAGKMPRAIPAEIAW